MIWRDTKQVLTLACNTPSNEAPGSHNIPLATASYDPSVIMWQNRWFTGKGLFHFVSDTNLHVTDWCHMNIKDFRILGNESCHQACTTTNECWNHYMGDEVE